jgi:CRISPR-associated exonuclease Cas4
VIPAVPLLMAIVGAAVVVVSARSLWHRHRESRWGTLDAIDAGRSRTLRSERYRLVGRPDVLRRAPDGRLVPVEVKARAAPPAGPYPSHRIQLWAYCLLVEEADGRPPPFGVVRYADREFRIPWDARARAELIAVRGAVAIPYDGRANPSPARCGGCRWAPSCDRRAGAARPA